MTDAVELIEVEPANPYRLELEDLNAAIRGERQPLLGRADALGQVRAIDALFRSAAERARSSSCEARKPFDRYPRCSTECNHLQIEENHEEDRPCIAALVTALAAALPAVAATPVFKGTVGPGSRSRWPRSRRRPDDQARGQRQVDAHNFHLTGPGVNVKTSVSAIGTKTFTVTLKKGIVQVRVRPAPRS